MTCRLIGTTPTGAVIKFDFADIIEKRDVVCVRLSSHSFVEVLPKTVRPEPDERDGFGAGVDHVDGSAGRLRGRKHSGLAAREGKVKSEIRYAVDHECFRDAYRLEWVNSLPLQGVTWMAEAAAQDYWDNHDGWETSWPINITIWDADGNKLGECEVEMETVPTFSAGEITAESDASHE